MGKACAVRDTTYLLETEAPFPNLVLNFFNCPIFCKGSSYTNWL